MKCHDCIDRLLNNNKEMVSQLSQRLSTLKILRQLWNKGEIMQALDHLQVLSEAMKLNNPQNISIISDFFLAIDLKGHGLSLDACVKILPLLYDLLDCSKLWQSEMIIYCIYKSLLHLLIAFGELIRNTRGIMIAGGVDITREARLIKCNICHDIFLKTSQRIDIIKHQFRNHANIMDVIEQYQKSMALYC